MQKNVFYFAYGANMNQSMAKKRGLNFNNYSKGWLQDYELVFNIPEPELPGTGYANISQKKGSIVEGIIYETDETSLMKIDLYEVVPTDYIRTKITINSSKGLIECFIYLGNKEVLQKDLLPATGYIEEIRAEVQLLSPFYQKFLQEIKSYNNYL